MQTHQSMEFKSESSTFYLIYRAAKNKSLQMLTHARSQVDIDIFDPKELSRAITRLAFEHDIESVNFLIRHGASLQWAVQGFAQAGHVTEAFTFLDQSTSRHADGHPRELINMVYGFALGGHVGEVDILLNHVDKTRPQSYSKLINIIANGYAVGGHIDKAYHFLDKMNRKHYDTIIESLYQSIACGLSHGGYIQDALALLDKIKHIKHHEIGAILTIIASGCAQHGYATEAYLLIDNIKSNHHDRTEDTICLIAKQFALGGHVKEAYQVLNKIKSEHPSLTFVAYGLMATGFAQGGHINDAFILLDEVKNLNPNYIAAISQCIIQSFSNFGHIKHAYTFLEKLKHEYPAHATISLITSARYEQKNNRSITQGMILKSLTLEESYARTQLARELKPYVNTYNTLSLIPKADVLRTQMDAKKLNYDQVIGLTNQDLRLFLLIGHSLVYQKGLPTVLFMQIATYLSPIKPTELRDLSNKFIAPIYRGRGGFFDDQKPYEKLLLDEPLMQASKQESSKRNEQTPSVHLAK